MGLTNFIAAPDQVAGVRLAIAYVRWATDQRHLQFAIDTPSKPYIFQTTNRAQGGQSRSVGYKWRLQVWALFWGI